MIARWLLPKTVFKFHNLLHTKQGTEEEGDGDGAAEHGEVVLQPEEDAHVPAQGIELKMPIILPKDHELRIKRYPKTVAQK